MIKPQWFVNCEDMANRAMEVGGLLDGQDGECCGRLQTDTTFFLLLLFLIAIFTPPPRPPSPFQVVRTGELELIPKSHESTWNHFLSNTKVGGLYVLIRASLRHGAPKALWPEKIAYNMLLFEDLAHVLLPHLFFVLSANNRVYFELIFVLYNFNFTPPRVVYSRSTRSRPSLFFRIGAFPVSSGGDTVFPPIGLSCLLTRSPTTPIPRDGALLRCFWAFWRCLFFFAKKGKNKC